MENMTEKCDLVYDLLKQMMKETLEKDKFTREKIDEAIERKNDIEKEANLKFIEELDKESRQAVKQMIATGLYSYKNLHQLKNQMFPILMKLDLKKNAMLLREAHRGTR